MISVPFLTRRGEAIRRAQWRLPDRIVTPRFTRDVDELRTWTMDIRRILSDNPILDRENPPPEPGGITRETMADAIAQIQRRAPVEANALLLSQQTLEEISLWGRDELDEQTRRELMESFRDPSTIPDAAG